MIRRFEEVKLEYDKERKAILKTAIDNVKRLYKPITKTIKLKTTNGVIPYIPSLPRTRFYYESSMSVSGTIEPILKYKPLLTNNKEIDVYFFSETTIHDEPFTEDTEILIRLINKTIADSKGTLNQKLKEVSDFLDIDFGDILKFYEDMRYKTTKIIRNENFDFKSFSEYFCSICCLFGCRVHKLSSNACFKEESISCYCNKLEIYNTKSDRISKGSEINLDKKIEKIYKSFNFDECLTSFDIFLNFNKIVPCSYILKTFGKSKQRVKKLSLSKYKFKGIEKPLFNICSHSGACSDNTLCECFVNDTGCDFRCLCNECDFMFVGCSCKKGCDLKCRCIRLNKECGSFCKCVVCVNNLVTKSLPKKTFVYPSTISGYGCFAEESIKQGEFVVEYIGEIIPKEEGQRRSNFYDANKVSYLFDYSFANKTGFVDANFIGNNSRFINHSICPNIYSKIVEVDRIRRICFFALRDIKIGEELFFNYNYKNEIKEMFGLID